VSRRALARWALAASALLTWPAGAGAHQHEWDALHLLRAPVGIQAPDFTLLDPEGRRVSLGDLRGRPVIVNFWATWCAPCDMEMPSIQRLADATAGLGLVVLAVNLREPASRVAAFARERRISFPMLLDADGAVFNRYQVQALPFTVLVDARGHVQAVAEGPRDWASAEARSLIERLASQEGAVRSKRGASPRGAPSETSPEKGLAPAKPALEAEHRPVPREKY